jgi:MFS transporter, MFS domain-containing protein family, molybdate-anion transporter
MKNLPSTLTHTHTIPFFSLVFLLLASNLSVFLLRLSGVLLLQYRPYGVSICRALDVLLVMTGLLIVTGALCAAYTPAEEQEDREYKATHPANGDTSSTAKDDAAETVASQHHKLLTKYHAFRYTYMSVYSVIMLADWMQGTHMYTLYMSYGVNVSALFLTGFLSGGIFAPFLGSFVDKFGRKRSCIVYCLLEISINIMEGYDNFTILLIGRVMGGVSTNLLFSAFESWMTTEHRRHGFPDEWLSRTYSQCSIVNGSTAIAAGIVAQFLEDYLGHIGPFHGAVALTALALMLVLGWEENYGEEHAGDHTKSSLVHQFTEGWRTTMSDSRIWRIGLTQALSEGAMYTFVFMWVPTLLSLEPPGGVPTGCVFSALMMSITMGGLVFPPLQAFITWMSGSKEHSSELCASLVYLLAAASMAVPVMCLSPSSPGTNDEHCQEFIIASFLIVEFCVGLFMPVAGTLRSKYVPDNLQGAILNIFRLPLNTIVVSGTYATNVLEPSLVFKLVSGCFFAAALLQATMIPQSQQQQPSRTSGKTKAE